MDKVIKSPITQTSNVRIYKKIPAKEIVKKYNEDLKIDVSRFFKIDFIEIYKCLDTHLLFYYPFDLTGDDKLYEDLQMRNDYYSVWNWEHEVTSGIINEHDVVLEVGCGTGSFIEKLQKNNIRIEGLELNKKAVNVCQSKGLSVHNQLLEEHTRTHTEFYDVVCSFQVLEHIANPKSYIESCIDAVKVGGKIVFGVPNNNPFLFKRDMYHTLNLPPHHMGLWSVKAFQSLTKFFNLKLIDIKVEELSQKRYYLDTFLAYNKLSFLKKVTNKLPDSFINRIASLRNWQGRNIVAIFEKQY